MFPSPLLEIWAYRYAQFDDLGLASHDGHRLRDFTSSALSHLSNRVFEMGTVGAIIRKLQDYDPNDSIKDLLEKPEAVAGIRKLLNSQPMTPKIDASKFVRSGKSPTKQKSVSEKALNAILRVKNIQLSTEIEERYSKCQQCPSTFWVEAGIPLDLKTNSTKSMAAILCEFYLGITRLKTQCQWDTIIWRFFVIFLHDLVVSFGGTYCSSNIDNLVVLLSDTDEMIRENLKGWVARGSRYVLLSKSFDNGVPFLLPQSVTDKTWEYGLPLSGPSYERAIEHLLDKGIRRKSKAIGADVLGTEIREAIMKHFRWEYTILPEHRVSRTCSNSRVGQSLLAPSSLYGVLQSWRSQENRALAGHQDVVEANRSGRLPGQDQSNVPNLSHDHSTSTSPIPTETSNLAFEQFMVNQDAGGYQDSRNFWGSAASQTGQPSNLSSGGYFSLFNQDLPADFWNGVYIPLPSFAVPLDFSNGVYIPLPSSTIPLDFSNGVYIPIPVETIPSHFSNDVHISPSDQALPLDSFNNEQIQDKILVAPTHLW